MGAFFRSLRGARAAAKPGAGLAVEFASDRIVILERREPGPWRRFASVELDDPLFESVIGLLRAEAEERAGRQPAHLFLPGEQVLRLEARLSATDPAQRLAEALRHAARATGLAPDELAVAVGPSDPAGGTPILVTHAQTVREATAYARRWGFLPGPVSTRHAGGLGPEGPIFQLPAEAPGGTGKHPAPPPRPGRFAGHPARRWLVPVLASALALVLLLLGAGGAAGQPATAPPETAAPRGAPLPPVSPRMPRTAPRQGGAGETGVQGSEREAGAREAGAREAGTTKAGTAAAGTPPVDSAGAGPAPIPATGGARPAPAGAPMPPTAPRKLAARAPAEAGPKPHAPAAADAAADTAAGPGPESASPPGATAGTPLSVARPAPLPPAKPKHRRPLAVVAVPAQNLALLGVMELAGGRAALIRAPDGTVAHVRIDDRVAGWRVVAIAEETVELARGAERRRLRLIAP